MRLNGLRPAGLVHNYTNTHAAYSNVPWAWTRRVPQCLADLSLRRRAPAVATAGPPSGLSWVSLSLAPMGAGANRPPLTGGQLTFVVLVDVLPAARVHWRPPGRVRLRLPRKHMIFGSCVKLGSFSRSHSWAGYVCFVLLRKCISVSVTYGDSCN